MWSPYNLHAAITAYLMSFQIFFFVPLKKKDSGIFLQSSIFNVQMPFTHMYEYQIMNRTRLVFDIRKMSFVSRKEWIIILTITIGWRKNPLYFLYEFEGQKWACSVTQHSLIITQRTGKMMGSRPKKSFGRYERLRLGRSSEELIFQVFQSHTDLAFQNVLKTFLKYPEFNVRYVISHGFSQKFQCHMNMRTWDLLHEIR